MNDNANTEALLIVAGALTGALLVLGVHLLAPMFTGFTLFAVCAVMAVPFYHIDSWLPKMQAEFLRRR